MCNHKLLKRKVVKVASLPNPELIQIWDVRTGDFNDVYSSDDYRGTYSQIQDVLLEKIKDSGYRNVEDDYGDNLHFGYSVYYNNGEVKFYASADSQGTDKNDLRSWTTFVDLIKERD